MNVATYVGVGGCVIGGFLLDDPAIYLFGAFFWNTTSIEGTNKMGDEVRYILKKKRPIYGLWRTTKTKLCISRSKSFKLTISSKQVYLLPRATHCRTTMSDGTIDNSSCE